MAGNGYGESSKTGFSPMLKNENYPYNVPGRSKAAGIVSIRFKMIENTRKSV